MSALTGDQFVRHQCVRNILLSKPKLHLVFGGRVSDPQSLDFNDLENIDMIGVYANFEEAEEAWRGAAQRTVDDAEMKYVVVHLHRLLEPAIKV